VTVTGQGLSKDAWQTMVAASAVVAHRNEIATNWVKRP
jgi:hypothetical protein